MATETVPHGPQAFAGYDSSIYMVWIRALADMMMSGGNPGQLDRHTVAEVGSLIHTLTLAASELQESERMEAQS